MQTIITDQLINYDILGGKNTTTIVILHGWKRSLQEWLPIATLLSQKNKVVLLDLPGMGNSSVPQKDLDIYDYTEIISTFLSKLALKNITLLGHSLGGKIAIPLAAGNRSIKKLILLDTSGIKNQSLATKLKIIIYKTLKPFKPLAPKFLQNLFINFIASDDYKTAGNLTASFKKIVAQDVVKEASKITIPTLIIWGENDHEVPVTSGVKLQTLIKDSTLRLVWGAGHDPHYDKPQKLLEIFQEFI